MAAILILDDEEAICSALRFALEDEYQVYTSTDAQTAFQVLAGQDVNLVLLDQRLGAVDGLEVLQSIRMRYPQTLVIAMTAYGSIESSVEAMQRGAYYYLTKPLVTAELRILIRKALDYQNLNMQVDHLSREVQGKYQADGIGLVGRSAALQRVMAQIEKVKDIDSTILISGESGTGKELVARAIHYLGRRHKAPFEVVNCAAIPDQLLESELFGFEKGAFTGATSRRKGKFELADNGTLLLDEVAELNPVLQAKLLRVLQNRQITPLGSEVTKNVDLRIIAATNKNLKEAVAKGTFREDLYFGLNVIPIHIPPLRERKEDLPALVNHLLTKYTKAMNRQITGFSRGASLLLENYDFPGNVRELENIIERVVAMSSGPRIEVPDLPSELMGEIHPIAGNSPWIPVQFGEPLHMVEKKVILATLDALKGNRRETARVLGMSERNLRNKLSEYRLEGGAGVR